MEISDLIFKYLIDDLSPDEEQALNKWLENPYNKLQFDKICNTNNIGSKFEKFDEIDVDQDWKRVAKRTTQKKLLVNVYRYAAAILLPIGLFLAVFYTTNIPDYFVDTEAPAVEPPVVDQPILITDNGIQHTLGGNDTILSIDNTKIQLRAENVFYQKQADIATDSVRYNILKTPNGVKYKLTLADGSIVWLNAETSLKYPVHFNGENREVFLTEGEAFFDVAKNEQKPFIVNFSNHKLKVLGTEFNVKAYQEEDYQHVTLVEGSVSIADGETSVVLKPNQQAVINNKAELSVQSVNTDFYTAWKEDLFMYKQEKLGRIIRDLERQYDMKIFYQSQKLKERTFSMRISKPESFREVLDYIATTEKVSFEIRGNTVTIKKGTRW